MAREKTKEQLLEEIKALRKRIKEFEKTNTERIRAEEKLREKSFMLDSTSSIIAEADLDGNMIFANPAFLNAWGFDSLDEVLGRSFPEFWDVSAQLDEVMDVLVGSGPGRWSGALEATRKDGTHFDLYVSAATVYNREGKPIALMSTSFDITERKKAEEALKATNQQLIASEQQMRASEQETRKLEKIWRESFNSLEDVMILIDRDFNIERINVNALRLCGKKEKDVIGKKCYKIFHGMNSPHEECP